MARKLIAPIGFFCLLVLCAAGTSRAAAPTPQKPIDVLTAALNRWAEVVQPPQGRPVRTFVTRLKVVKAQGLPGAAAGMTVDLAFQAPDRLRVRAETGGH